MTVHEPMHDSTRDPAHDPAYDLAYDLARDPLDLVSRAFRDRAVRWLGAEGGVRQYLDIGTRVPTEPGLHRVVQEAGPGSRVLHTGGEPLALRYAEALLGGGSAAVTEYAQADARDPEAVVEAAGKVLDLGRPVALLLLARLHFISDEDGAYDLVRRLLEPLAPGSFLVLSHATGDFDRADRADRAGTEPEGAPYGQAAHERWRPAPAARSREEFARFFKGLELVEPGITLAADWRPDPGGPVAAPGHDPVAGYVGVARTL
ncbi:SAM-dependent methyltransferase [Streptomyces sp. NPDC001780]